MGQKEIEYGNKLISAFCMVEDTVTRMYSFFEPDHVLNLPMKWYDLSELKFHTSFDWLMPVTQKIVSLGYNVEYIQSPKYIACRIYANEGVKSCGAIVTDSVYKAVILFIEYYNKQSN